jgi:acyl-CoA thioesterase YciA
MKKHQYTQFVKLVIGWFVTKAMSKIDFRTSPKLGDIVEIGMDLVRLGNTSITFKCNVRNKYTKEDVITVDENSIC